MQKPLELSLQSEKLLQQLLFDMSGSFDKGMHKYYEWTNEFMKFSLSYDRGYYDCYIIAHKKPEKLMPIIKLLQFLKNDREFYEKEMEEARMWRTLKVDRYVNTFFSNYALIREYLANLNQAGIEEFENF